MHHARQPDPEDVQDDQPQGDVGQQVVQLADHALLGFAARRRAGPGAVFVAVGVGPCDPRAGGVGQGALAEVAIGDQPGGDGAGEGGQQQEHHRAAGGTVAQVAPRLAAHEREQVAQRRDRTRTRNR